MRVTAIAALLKETYQEWSKDRAQTLGAALAYFTLFSLSPLLVVVISIAGLALGEEAARGELFGRIQGIVGDQAARSIQGMVASAGEPRSGIIGAVIGTVTLLLGASGVFGQLKQALNIIWEADPKRRGGVRGFVKDKFLGFTMVLGIGFLLLVSLILSALLGAFAGVLADLLPALWPVVRIANLIISLAVITLLFAMIFKVLPDVAIRWSDVWLGAVVTALLFTIGKELIGIYMGLSNVGSPYGAAGSLVVILVWTFYAAQILFFGAEFAKVYARRRGSWHGASVKERGPEQASSETQRRTSPSGQSLVSPVVGYESRMTPERSSVRVLMLGIAAMLAFVVGTLAGAAFSRRS